MIEGSDPLMHPSRPQVESAATQGAAPLEVCFSLAFRAIARLFAEDERLHSEACSLPTFLRGDYCGTSFDGDSANAVLSSFGTDSAASTRSTENFPAPEITRLKKLTA